MLFGTISKDIFHRGMDKSGCGEQKTLYSPGQTKDWRIGYASLLGNSVFWFEIGRLEHQMIRRRGNSAAHQRFRWVRPRGQISHSLGL